MTHVRPADVGILLVHGIGEQQRGQTLREYGHPVADYAVRYMQRLHATASVDMDDDAGECHVDFATAGDRRASWLIRESWWSGVVQPPPYRAVVVWLLLDAPWLLLRELIQWPVGRGVPVLQRSGAWPWVSFYVVAYGLAVAVPMYVFFVFFVLAVAIPLLQVGIVVLFLMGWLPGARRLLRRLARRIKVTIGDSYVFLQRSHDFDRLVDKVAEDIFAMASEARALVIVAHSQGAAVVQHVLATRPIPARLKAVVALGSGMDKLIELERARGRPLNTVAWSALAWGMFTSYILVLVYGAPDFVFRVLVILAVLLPLSVVLLARRAPSPLAALPGLGSTWRWYHVYSRYDLVPDGRTRPPSGVGVHVVENNRSWLTDHTAYMSNASQVVALIFDLALHCTGALAPRAAASTNQLRRVRTARSARALAYGTGLLAVPSACLILAFSIAVGLQYALGPAYQQIVVPVGVLFAVSPVVGLVLWRRLWLRWHGLACSLEWQDDTIVPPRFGWLRPMWWLKLVRRRFDG